MRTISVLNAKGGCGKSTLATGLAAALAWEGYQVALGDLDPQKSSSDWVAARPEEYPPVTGLSADDGPVRAPAGTDFLILDTPAGLSGSELGQVVRRSGTLIIPVLPSYVDIRAAHRFLGHLFELKAVAEGHAKVGLVANRVKPHTIVYRELTGFLESFRAPFVAHLRDSMNYVRAFNRGLSPSDLPAWRAWPDWEEWEELMSWVRSRRSVGKGG